MFTFTKCSYCNCHITYKCKERHKHHFWSQISKNVFCPQTGCFVCRWFMCARCCMDAVRAQWPWELMVRGCAPVSEVSTDMETWLYELTFILVSLTAWSSGTINTPSSSNRCTSWLCCAMGELGVERLLCLCCADLISGERRARTAPLVSPVETECCCLALSRLLISSVFYSVSG